MRRNATCDMLASSEASSEVECAAASQFSYGRDNAYGQRCIAQSHSRLLCASCIPSEFADAMKDFRGLFIGVQRIGNLSTVQVTVQSIPPTQGGFGERSLRSLDVCVANYPAFHTARCDLIVNFVAGTRWRGLCL